MDNLEKLATLDTQDTGQKQTKQKTQHRKIKKRSPTWLYPLHILSVVNISILLLKAHRTVNFWNDIQISMPFYDFFNIHT
jgi:hypothetical protein